MKITVTFEKPEREATAGYDGPRWKDIDGRVVALPDLNDSHLLAIFGCLNKQIYSIQKLSQYYYSPLFDPTGAASDAASLEMDALWSHQFDCQMMRTLITAEIEHRGLTVPERLPPPRPLGYVIGETITYDEVFASTR